jgi:hypothetical protein
MIQKYTQTTYETCLAVSLLQAVDKIKPIKINQKIELEVINHSMKFSRDDFVAGHLDYITNHFNVNIQRIVDNKSFLNYINKIKTSSKIANKVEKVTLQLIDETLKQNQPIVYIDAYTLFGYYHAPHFITVLEKQNNNYKIFDTWDGKTKTISGEKLSNAISSLRNHLKFAPQIITIQY